MNMLKVISGNVVLGTGKLVEFILEVFIRIIEMIVLIVVGVGRGLLGILGAGGCLFLMFLGPVGIALLLNPITIIVIALFIIIPILGTKSVSYLKYIKYMVTEYLFDSADNLIKGKKKEFQSFNEYGNKYIRMEEEKRRKEQQKRQEQQQQEWEQRFKQWYDYQNSQRGSTNYGGGYGPGFGGQTYVNPTSEFKSKYEKSCNLLGVSNDTDIYEVKLAYRKKAKEYHPDINKSPDATVMFQKINDAYEFLSEDNIARYKGLR